jgi:hypothetical protein
MRYYQARPFVQNSRMWYLHSWYRCFYNCVRTLKFPSPHKARTELGFRDNGLDAGGLIGEVLEEIQRKRAASKEQRGE